MDSTRFNPLLRRPRSGVTERSFSDDQVGSVMVESNSSGTQADRFFQDAFGNSLDSWANGLIGGTRGGRHHNTKEFDEDIGLVYMYQRWYSPELGIFVSSAPYPPMTEHRYSFAGQNPIANIDPDERRIFASGTPTERARIRTELAELYNLDSFFAWTLDFLDRSQHDIVIQYDWRDKSRTATHKTNANWNGNQPGPGSGSEIFLNEADDDFCTIADMTQVLAHEICHAYLNAQGMRDTRIDPSSRGRPNGPWSMNETQVTIMANFAFPIGSGRPSYGVWPW